MLQRDLLSKSSIVWVTGQKISVWDSLHQNTHVSMLKLTLFYIYSVLRAQGYTKAVILSKCANQGTRSISERTPIHVQMEKLWASGSNKMNMEISLSRNNLERQPIHFASVLLAVSWYLTMMWYLMPYYLVQ